MHDSFRFLNAKDSINARKAALLAMVLMGIGSVIWFIPPWASAILYPDAAAAYPDLGNKAADAVYLVFARNAMPVGTVGLLLAGLFAASMSSMDSALNKNAGIIARSIYQPFSEKRGKPVSDQHLLRLSMLFSFVSGIAVIVMALYFKSLKEFSLFDLMMSISAMLQVPILIPLILGLLIKRTPAWAPWITVLIGLAVSWTMFNVLTADLVASWMGLEPLTRREATDFNLILTLAAQVFVTGGFFCLTTLFYEVDKDRNLKSTTAFFEDLETEVVADIEQDDYDRRQRHRLGTIVMCMGGGIFVMTLIPNPIYGRAMFAACAAVIFLIGAILRRSAVLSRSSQKEG